MNTFTNNMRGKLFFHLGKNFQLVDVLKTSSFLEFLTST